MAERSNLPNGLPVTYDLLDYILERLNKLQDAAKGAANQQNVRVEGLSTVADNDVVILAKEQRFRATGAKDKIEINFPGVVFTSKPMVVASIVDKDGKTRKGPQAYLTISDVTIKGFIANTFYSGASTNDIPVSIHYIAIGNVKKSK
jgi:hypothetical protein